MTMKGYSDGAYIILRLNLGGSPHHFTGITHNPTVRGRSAAGEADKLAFTCVELVLRIMAHGSLSSTMILRGHQRTAEF